MTLFFWLKPCLGPSKNPSCLSQGALPEPSSLEYLLLKSKDLIPGGSASSVQPCQIIFFPHMAAQHGPHSLLLVSRET